MKTKPFKFKERVVVSRANDDWPGGIPKNRMGRVWQRDEGDYVHAFCLAIRFDQNIDGHNLSVGGGPRCKRGHGWNVERRFIRRLPPKKAKP